MNNTYKALFLLMLSSSIVFSQESVPISLPQSATIDSSSTNRAHERCVANLLNKLFFAAGYDIDPMHTSVGASSGRVKVLTSYDDDHEKTLLEIWATFN